MTLKVIQSIPQCFIDKMDVDKRRDALNTQSVIAFSEGKAIIDEQKRARRLCQLNVEKHNPPGAGTPVAAVA